MIRNRSCRGTNATDFVLLAVFLVLVYIFLIRRSGMSKVETVLHEHEPAGSYIKGEQVDPEQSKNELVPDKLDSKDLTNNEREVEVIKQKVAGVPDARTSNCKNVPRGAEIPASIIVDFYDYSFMDLKVTLESVKKYTTDSLIREIIIIDDGSTLDYIKRDAQDYINKLPKAVFYRNEDRQGQAKARMRAAKEANGANLIFLDSKVVVSPGWIEPLVAHIQQKQKVIALPHYDKINDPVTYDYIQTDLKSSPSFNWGLELVMSYCNDCKNDNQPFSSAALRNNAFAVTKIYFMEIGGLDSGLSDGGGDALELSFRTWLCGGSIETLPCSRVGVLNYHQHMKITSNRNKWRLSQLWMKDYIEIVNKNLGRNPEDSTTNLDKTSLSDRKSELNKLTCKEFKWYIDVVARDLYLPPTDSKMHGRLQVRTGNCARVADDARVELGHCSPDVLKKMARDIMFSLTNQGQLKWGELCLTVQGSAFIVAEQCTPGNDHQIWKYDNNKLINKWSEFCAMHVTDPDPQWKGKNRQIMMAQVCKTDTTEKAEFSSWTFLDST